MKYQKGFASLLLIVLIVAGLAAAGGGYAVYKDKQQHEKFVSTLGAINKNKESAGSNTAESNDTSVSPVSTTPTQPKATPASPAPTSSPESKIVFTLKSQFLKDDATAQKIASGENPGVDISTFPLKAIRKNVPTDSFAYRVVSALRMLGYQEGYNSEAYVGQEFLGDFKRVNGLPVTTTIDASTLQKIDSQLALREVEDLKLAKNFPLYPYFMTAPKNEPTKEHAAALFDIAFSALPSNIMVWSEANFKAYMRDQGGSQFSNSAAGYKVCLSVLYPEVDDNCTINTRGVLSFWGSDLAIVGTQIHEYSHFLDGNVYPKEAGTSRGVVDTTSFYDISYDTSKQTIGSNGWKIFPIRRPSSARNEFVSAYAMGWSLSDKASDAYTRTAQEDFAESMSMFVTEGKVFRELAKTSPVISQKYDWLKQHVFNGREYATGEIKGIAFIKAHPTALLEDQGSGVAVSTGAYNAQHYSVYLPDFAWDYKL
ncbi:MAG: hypothetical protein JWN89_354 [Parcubacteria group bacterium]|nr:hypothetical protein [Parcubacteria group bacterium]